MHTCKPILCTVVSEYCAQWKDNIIHTGDAAQANDIPIFGDVVPRQWYNYINDVGGTQMQDNNIKSIWIW